MENNKIGVFDSGVGGLSVLKEIVKVLPNESLVYFADSARCPYGTKDTETIYQFSKQICEFLVKEHNVKKIIIACNTATIASVDRLKEDFDIPVIGVPDFGVQHAYEVTKNKKIGLLATDSTVRSQYYQDNLKRLDPTIEVYGQGCPDFVLDVEAGKFDGPEVEGHVTNYTKGMLGAGVDTIILGCTHFPFLSKTISKVVGSNINLVDPADKTVQYLKEYLNDKDLTNKNEATYEFYSSATNNDTLKLLVKEILNKDVEVETIDIDRY